MKTRRIPHLILMLLSTLLLSTLSACASRKHIQLPASSPSASVLESYSIEDLLIYHEGLRLKPYTDIGNKLTIGVGRNLEDSGISKEEAMMLLHNDIKRVSAQLDENIPWWRSLSDTRQKVLISMAFNLGLTGLLGFHDMLSSLQEGDYSTAATHMLNSRWASQVGNRAMELAYMMENG